MHTRILQAPYSLVRRAKRVIAHEVEPPREPAGSEPILTPVAASDAIEPSIVVAGPPLVSPPDAVILPGESRKRTHRRPRYRLAQLCCILSAAASTTALVGMALEEAPLARISAAAAISTAIAALAFAWRSRLKSRVVEWALAAGAVALIVAAAVVALGDAPRSTEPDVKPAVSPAQRQQQG